jgi:hypothetical protein
VSDDEYVDHTLGVLYQVITTPGGEFSVSLLVGGQWLSGMAISGRAWWTQMAETLRQSGRGSGLDEAFDALGRMNYPAEIEVEAGVAPEFDEDRPIGFIHLRDARVHPAVGNEMPSEGTLIRCSLRHVAAWFIGQFGPEGYMPPAPIA